MRGAGRVGGGGREGGVAGGEGLVVEAELEAGRPGTSRAMPMRVSPSRARSAPGAPQRKSARASSGRRRGGVDRAVGQGELEVEPLGGEVLDEEGGRGERVALRVGVDRELPAAGRRGGIDGEGEAAAAGALVGKR